MLTVEFTNTMIVPPYFDQNNERRLSTSIEDFPVEDIMTIYVVSVFHDFDSEPIAIDDYFLVSYVNKTIQV